jgi:hypothetical protein
MDFMRATAHGHEARALAQPPRAQLSISAEMIEGVLKHQLTAERQISFGLLSLDVRY